MNRERSQDPRQMKSRFAGTCYTCKKPIKKGEEIIYWPNGNHAEHFACGEADYRNSLASFQDEENFQNQYPSYREWSDWTKPFRKSERLDFFYSYFQGKRFFLDAAPAKKRLGKKKTGWKRGAFEQKLPKAHAHYSKFSAKVTSWKYLVTKGGSPGYLILAPSEPPVGFIQIGKSIWPEPLFQNFHSGIV